MIYFTSDTHYGHQNILSFCSTRNHFKNVEEMNQILIDNWNFIINKNDIVYNLGDVSFTSLANTINILKQLNGQKHLIIGNHDFKLLKEHDFKKYWKSINNDFIGKIEKQKIHLYHFPLLSWNCRHYGSIHLYGHIHEQILDNGKSMNVGVDAIEGFKPISLDEVIEILKDTSIYN